MGLRHKGKYELSIHQFAFVYHYAQQYREWKREAQAILDTGIKAIDYDKESGGNKMTDPTMETASRRLYLESKVQIIEDTCREADKFIWMYLLKAVTEEGVTYQKLRESGMPCGRNYYFDRRRRFYWILYKKIG